MRLSSAVPSCILYCIEHRQDILSRHIALYIVYAVEHKTAVLAEYLDSPADFLIDFLRRTEWKCLLCIDATTPEYQVFTEFLFQTVQLHISTVELDWIDSI